MKLNNLLKPSQFNNMHSFNFLNDKSLVLKRNKYLLTYLAKTSWSWGRMYAILSEVRKIESRRQLAKNALRPKKRIGNETGTPTRERPLMRQRACSNRTRSQARKV